MTIGQNEPVRRHHDARSRASVPPLVAGAHIKAHHGRADPLNHVDDRPRIGIEQCLVFGGDQLWTGTGRRDLVEHDFWPGGSLHAHCCNAEFRLGVGVGMSEWSRRYGDYCIAARERATGSHPRDPPTQAESLYIYRPMTSSPAPIAGFARAFLTAFILSLHFILV